MAVSKYSPLSPDFSWPPCWNERRLFVHFRVRLAHKAYTSLKFHINETYRIREHMFSYCFHMPTRLHMWLGSHSLCHLFHLFRFIPSTNVHQSWYMLGARDNVTLSIIFYLVVTYNTLAFSFSIPAHLKLECAFRSPGDLLNCRFQCRRFEMSGA